MDLHPEDSSLKCSPLVKGLLRVFCCLQALPIHENNLKVALEKAGEMYLATLKKNDSNQALVVN